MGKLFLLLIVILLKIVLCKGFALLLCLLLFWAKGRQLHFDPDRWDTFLSSLPFQKIARYLIGIYLPAALLASVVSYAILSLADFPGAFAVAAALFLSGLLLTVCLWHTKGKVSARQKYQKFLSHTSENK